MRIVTSLSVRSAENIASDLKASERSVLVPIRPGISRTVHVKCIFGLPSSVEFLVEGVRIARAEGKLEVKD